MYTCILHAKRMHKILSKIILNNMSKNIFFLINDHQFTKKKSKQLPNLKKLFKEVKLLKF